MPILDWLAEPFDLVEGDGACSEAGDDLVDVAAPLVAEWQAAEVIEPSMSALGDPAVTPEPLAALDAFERDAQLDPTGPALSTSGLGIIGLIGVPRASVTRWRFVPGLPRPVGFGPVGELLFSPGPTRCPGKPGFSRCHRLRARASARPDAGAPTPPPPASSVGTTSNSSRSRGPSQPAAYPRIGLSAA